MSSRKGQRSAARVVREQLAREQRRKRTLWTSVIAVSALVIGGLVGWGVYASQQSDEYVAPKGAVEDGSGVAVGSGPVTVSIYEDFNCPACAQFDQRISGTLDTLLTEGKVRVVYHPVAILDHYSSTEYSTRSSAASACAAEEGKFREYTKVLFERQPADRKAGLSNNELIDIGAEVGLNRDSFGSCVRDGKFKPWTQHVTEAAAKAQINSTPTVLVAGKPVENSVEAITAAVAAANK